MMDSVLTILIKNIANSGIIGAVLAVMLWFNYQMVKKLFEVIKTNTQAITRVVESQYKVAEVIELNNRYLIETKAAHQARRQEFNRTNKPGS